MGPFRALSLHGRSGVWLGAVGEIVVVALGVLLAFGLNAWWVESTSRADEQTHLRALARDFQNNVRLYMELITRANRSSTRSLELLQLARKQPDADPVAVSRLMGPVFSSYREKPALDAYQALVNSAGLTLIRDEELRSALAGFADRATDPYQERFADQLYMAFITTYIGRTQVAGNVAADGTEPTSFVELLSDPVFQEHLAYRAVVEGDVVSYYCDQLKEAQSIFEQLLIQTLARSQIAELPAFVEPAPCAKTDEPAQPAETPGAASTEQQNR
jgi:hypothetical protein